MAKVHGFNDQRDIRRVIKAVKKIEAVDITGQGGGKWDHQQTNIIAMITDVFPIISPFRFGWIQQRLRAEGTAWETPEGALSGTVDENYAVTPNGETIAPGTRVVLVRVMVHITHPEDPAKPDEFEPAWCIMSQFDEPLKPVPNHDHRDNFNGGLAFSVYHPGTALPMQTWFE